MAFNIGDDVASLEAGLADDGVEVGDDDATARIDAEVLRKLGGLFLHGQTEGVRGLHGRSDAQGGLVDGLKEFVGD